MGEVIFRTKSPKLAGLEEIIIAEYIEGAGVKTLANKYNNGHEGAVRKILKENNIALRNRKECLTTTVYKANKSKGRIKIKCDNTIQGIISLYSAGESPTQIGKKYNINHVTVKNILIRNNIPTRNQSEAARLDTTKKLKEDTNLKNNGVRNPMQQRIIFDRAMRSGYRFKSHSVGDTVFNNLQGYEPQCIEFLINTLNYLPSDICAGRGYNIPTIKYIKDSKDHFYFPDIYVISKNLLIEVKSVYIFERSREATFIKQQSSKEAGFNHHIMIFDNRGRYLKTIP
jgi:hypothetical protein